MSDLDDAYEALRPQLHALAAEQGAALVGRFRGLVEDGTPAAKEIAAIFAEAAKVRLDLAFAKDDVERDQLAGAVESHVRRARTLALAEAVVASDSAAAWLEGAAHAALGALADGLRLVLGTIVKNAAEGAVAGLMGGSGGGAVSVAKKLLGG